MKATVTVVQNNKLARNNAAVWNVQISKFNKKGLCPSGQLNWHVHQYPGYGIRDANAVLSTSAPLCDKAETGGHYDPTFACGGASQNKANGVCEILRTTNQVPLGEGNGLVKEVDSYAACKPDNQSSCEIGDQSGKLGPLKAKRKRVQQFKDQWMTPIDNLEGKSMVLHCCYDDGQTNPDGSVKLNCGPRLACANLE